MNPELVMARLPYHDLGLLHELLQERIEQPVLHCDFSELHAECYDLILALNPENRICFHSFSSTHGCRPWGTDVGGIKRSPTIICTHKTIKSVQMLSLI